MFSSILEIESTDVPSSDEPESLESAFSLSCAVEEDQENIPKG